MALITCSDQVPPGDGYRSLAVVGSSGAVYSDDHHNVQLVYRGGHPRAVGVDEQGGHDLAPVQAFVSDLRRGNDLSAGVLAWRTAMAVADAARRSVTTRQAAPPGSS